MEEAIRNLAAMEDLDAVVNNAAAVDFSNWASFDYAEWQAVFRANVDAPVLLAREFGSRMPSGSSLVNIASTDGYTGSFASLAYSASKAALINATKSLGNVLGPKGIRVNAIAPGWVDSGTPSDASYNAASFTPLGRNGTPDDIAQVVSFLLSGSAAFVNGATWVVDGGYTNVDAVMKQESAVLHE